MNNINKAYHPKLTADQGYVVLPTNDQSLGDQNNNNESHEISLVGKRLFYSYEITVKNSI